MVRFRSIDAVIKAIAEHQPDVVITVGQAAGSCAITPERIASNVDDFRIPDNDGIQVIDEAIVEGGPDAYFTTLPVKAMVCAMQVAGIPAQVSNTAGTFVCNHLFYGVQHHLANTNIRHGFIHIPLLPEQAADNVRPSMSLNMIAEGLAVAAQAILDNEKDIQLGAGTIC